MCVSRRTPLASAGAASVALATPGIVSAEGKRELRFIPHADVTSLDPVWTTADITRDHGNMVYDQLFGLDTRFTPHPRMLAGFTTSADGLTWELTPRDGLKFHDGEKVLARDCVASPRRWTRRDVPMRQFFQPAAFNKNLADIQSGWPVFHAVRRV